MGQIQELLEADHFRLGRLLDAASKGRASDLRAYAEFRAGLLRHIGMEEKILLPAVRRTASAEHLAAARQLKLDHAALAALLVPTPTHDILASIRTLLEVHDQIEEGPDGVYVQCESMAGDELGPLLSRLMAAPPVAMAPHHDGQNVFDAIRRLLCAAGRDEPD